MVDGLIWDWVGQLGESEEYKMERIRVDYFYIRSSEGGSPHLSRLRTDRLAPVSKFHYVLVHIGFMMSHKLSSFVSRRVGRYPTIPLGCIPGQCMGHPRMLVDISRGRRALGWGRTRPDSLIASRTVTTHGVFAAHVCRVVKSLPLQGLNWLEPSWHSRIWVTLAY
jgi:hypothetical protein